MSVPSPSRIPWLWRAIRLVTKVVDELRIQYGGRVASTATAGECTTKSGRCSWNSVAKSIEDCTKSCGIAWSEHDGVEPCTGTDGKDACGSDSQTDLGKPPVFSGKEEDFHVWAKNVENCVLGVFPNVRGALSFAVQSQDVVTAAAVALGVPELDADTSAEMRRTTLHSAVGPHGR